MKFKAICNLRRYHPSGAEGASYRVARSYLNQKVSPGYSYGEVFDYVFGSDSGLWLKDKDGITIIASNREYQCFEPID